MKYRKLGRSGLNVSEISLGSWLTYGGSVGNDAAHECVKKAFELGINFFDTANGYANDQRDKCKNDREGGSHGCQFIFSEKIPNNQTVYNIIQLLEDITEQHWDCKPEY